jgi:methyltransferase (TIGR00027 family)
MIRPEMSEPAIRNVSDTARWAAMYRALETARADALFRDPFAGKLAGERGEQIMNVVPERRRNAWAWSMRTYLFDRLIMSEIEQGADMVLNLAAGLDARPYRMSLPPSLQWIEVDLPELLAYKQSILGGEKPVCRLERVALDLADVSARRDLFTRLGSRAKRVVILTEGLLIYLSDEEVGTFARDLAAQATFQRWILDITSPGLLKMMKKQMGAEIDRAPFKFGPREGPSFFERHGWRVLEIESTLHVAAQMRRVGLIFRFFAKISDPKRPKPDRPWSATCLLGK